MPNIAEILSAAARIVLGIYGQNVFTELNKTGNIKLKGRVSPLVSTRQSAVYVYLGKIIDSAEMQYDSTLGHGGNIKGASVPDGRNKILVCYSGESTFGTKRNGDLQRKFTARSIAARFAAAAVIVCKIPLSVETVEAISDKRGARIICARNACSAVG